MNIWIGVGGLILLVCISYREWQLDREEQAWHADQERCARMLELAQQRDRGLSDAVLAAIPDEELTDEELARKIQHEVRSLGQFAELEAAWNMPAVEPRRRLA